MPRGLQVRLSSYHCATLPNVTHKGCNDTYRMLVTSTSRADDAWPVRMHLSVSRELLLPALALRGGETLRALGHEVDRIAVGNDHIALAFDQTAHDRGTDHAAMTRNVNTRARRHPPRSAERHDGPSE